MADQNQETKEPAQDDFLSSVKAKADSLKEAYGVVTPVVITDDDGTKIIGYMQKPDYDSIMYCTDCILNKQTSLAAEQALKSCLITSESDPRITSSNRQDGYIKAAFTMASLKMVKPYVDEYKKK